MKKARPQCKPQSGMFITVYPNEEGKREPLRFKVKRVDYAGALILSYSRVVAAVGEHRLDYYPTLNIYDDTRQAYVSSGVLLYGGCACNGCKYKPCPCNPDWKE